MKQAVITELSTKELYERLETEEMQLHKLKLHHAISPIENPNRIKEYRKTIARLKTEISSRELAEKKSQK
ncbi:MAG TPA: 50S ribosomal protein L29 [Bacteroidales bacterium]|jgi:large subunit ribosomal protein L29|nr:50S ribosomal protein L29 [Bacteroidales bacterium]OQA85154.1 MAG: 50S ribosomal protein L29 [Bacteroidetes bacterium ADurb.Bin234]HOS17227.1 50S ribosomal protein L29 [Bacteroidales bacterium]